MGTCDMRGKVAVVTGASRGIGFATAKAFAQAGAAVVLAARTEEALQEAAAAIRDDGGRALPVTTDVGDPGSVERLISTALATFGRLDAAFNNAGGGHMPIPIGQMSIDDFDRTVQVNLRGTFLCMASEIRAMLGCGGGAIVNMSSTAGVSGVRGMGAYAASKHGVHGLTKSAALEYAEQNIRVNAVSPGPIMTDRIAALPEAAREPIMRAVPMGRIGKPEEVAATVLWLCSDEAAFITGANILVDGGRMAVGA